MNQRRNLQRRTRKRGKRSRDMERQIHSFRSSESRAASRRSWEMPRESTKSFIDLPRPLFLSNHGHLQLMWLLEWLLLGLLLQRLLHLKLHLRGLLLLELLLQNQLLPGFIREKLLGNGQNRLCRITKLQLPRFNQHLEATWQGGASEHLEV